MTSKRKHRIKRIDNKTVVTAAHDDDDDDVDDTTDGFEDETSFTTSVRAPRRRRRRPRAPAQRRRLSSRLSDAVLLRGLLRTLRNADQEREPTVNHRRYRRRSHISSPSIYSSLTSRPLTSSKPLDPYRRGCRSARSLPTSNVLFRSSLTADGTTDSSVNSRRPFIFAYKRAFSAFALISCQIETTTRCASLRVNS